MTIREQHQATSLLGKARLERQLWDKASKEQRGDKPRSAWLQECLGVDPYEAKLRSNLLKRGVSDSQVWARIEAGSLTFEQALFNHREAKTKAPARKTVSQDSTTSRPKTPGQATKTCSVEQLQKDIKKRVDELAALVKKASAPSPTPSPTPPTIKPRFIDPKNQTDAFYNELVARIWEWLKENDFLRADYHHIYDLVNLTSTEFYETLEFLRRSLIRLEGTNQSLASRGMGLQKAFKALSLPMEDPTKSGFDLLKVRRAYKKLAGRYHPDRNGGKEIYRKEYQTINDAVKAIERVHQAAEQLRKG